MVTTEHTLVREGDVLAGKYRVEGILGSGGMGVVVAARHVALDLKVAVKLLLPASLRCPELVARFAREARALSRLTSEHVTRVLDVGTLDCGAPFLVMEHLEGRDLAAIVRAEGPLPIATAVDYVLQACHALAEAHKSGIIHRDLKPGNLFLAAHADGSASIKVLDFGISKLHDTREANVTSTQELLGSPLYMSPEQLLSSRDVDERADIWALGAVLHELVTGKAPFDAETIPQLCTQILNTDPSALRTFRSDVPVGLESVLSRMLSKDRRARFASVAELAEGLAPFGGPDAQLSSSRIARILGYAGVSPSARTINTPAPPEMKVVTDRAWTKTAEHAAPVRVSHARKIVALTSIVVVALTTLVVGFASTRRHTPVVVTGGNAKIDAVDASPSSASVIASSVPATVPSASASIAVANSSIEPRPFPRPSPRPRPSASTPVADLNLFETQK